MSAAPFWPAHRLSRQILIAGVGGVSPLEQTARNVLIRHLLDEEMPEGVIVAEFTTGGLDLAYELLRGYDGLVLVGPLFHLGLAGTPYVIEIDEEAVSTISDGAAADPHRSDPGTLLRFVKSLRAWPRRVVVVACEPPSPEQVQRGAGVGDVAVVGRVLPLIKQAIAHLEAEGVGVA